MSPFDHLFLAQRWVAVLLVTVLLGAAVVFSGCNVIPKAQKGGGARTTFPVGPENLGFNEVSQPEATLTQPENPNASSEQETSYERTTETMLAAPAVEKTVTTFPDGRTITVEVTKPAGTVVKDHVKQETKQSVSGSWKDTAREIGVKLAAMRPVQYAGIGLLVFGLAGFFYAPLRVILGGGKQLPAACAVAGLVLILLPSVTVGNERLIIGGVLVAGLFYWLSIRLTRKETIVDLNKNGVDDREESPATNTK